MRSNVRRSNSSSKTTGLPRLFFSTDKLKMPPQELNQLFVKAGLPLRDDDKLKIALKHSLLCLAVRILKDERLVGFVRVSGDGIFNATIWDFVIDPQLPDREAAKRLLIERLKREIKRSIPRCSISIFANFHDIPLLYNANFAEDDKGIRAMILKENYGSKLKNQLMKFVPLP